MPSNPKLLAEETASPDSTFVDGGLFVRRKGVIEILSSNFKLGRLKLHEDTYIGSYTHTREGKVYALSVWGCHLIRVVGKPRPEVRIRFDTILTPFLCTVSGRSP